VQSFGLAPFQGCIVCVSKPVHIYSVSGAAVTTIDSGPAPGVFNATVHITADGAQFGSPGHGFTITGGNSIGVGVDLQDWMYSRTGMTIAGNRDLKDGVGFEVIGPEGCGLPGCICPPNAGVICPPVGWYGSVNVSTNEAFGNGTGFDVKPRHAYGLGGPGTLQFLVRDNLASGSGTGFNVEPGASECDGCLNGATAYEVAVIHNAASSNGVGFALTVAGGTFDNLATGNSTTGFLVTEGGSAFKRNSAIGNGGPGVLLAVLAYNPVNLDSFAQNSFFDNDRHRPPLLPLLGLPAPPDPGPSAHCGVLNVGAVASYFWGEIPFLSYPPYPAVKLQASGNYWGSKQGPQPDGPGDTVGGICDQNNATTSAQPFSTNPANVIPVP